jgi:hypothetical protein
MTTTQILIGFIVDQSLSLDEYDKLIPGIREHFIVIQKTNGHTGTVEVPDKLVERVVRWENGDQDGGLELTLWKEFNIDIRKPYIKPGDVIKKPEAKVVDIPSKDLARIKKETTHVAGVIDREMKQLQKKFPDHRFELQFEFQRLGKQKFYKIKIRTYEDGK